MGLYDRTIGALLVGISFNTFLYGLVTYQFAAYYRTKFNDTAVTRYMVLFLFVLDTFHSVSVMYMAWDYIVTDFQRPATLRVADWPHTITPLATTLTALVTQLYLGLRIWRLTSTKLLYVIVILLAILSFVSGTIVSIEATVIKVLPEFHRFTPIAIVGLSTRFVTDIFISSTLVIIFARSRTGFHKTDAILNRLTRCAVQTGLFAGVFSLGNLITFVLFPETDLYIIFAIPLGRIYTNTLLDILLTRQLLQAEHSAGNGSIMMDSVYRQPSDTQVVSIP